MNIDSILTEWRYRLPAGYPKTADDFGILRDVILEMTDVDLTEAERIVRRAMGLDEAPEDEDLQSEPTQISVTGIMESPEAFEAYVGKTYAYSAGTVVQQIENLDALYAKIKQISQPQYDAVVNIITDTTPYYTLRRDDIRITGTALLLYNACKVVKIPNGHWSELFFAFMFKGRVKAGVAGEEDNIKSDVETSNPPANISVKSYESVTYDCGTLPDGSYNKLKKFIALGELLTGIDMETSTMSTIELNNILRELESEHLQDEIKEILKQEDSSFVLIKNAALRIRSILGSESPDYLESIIDAFCNDLDKTLQTAFVDKVNWWAMFNRKNNTLFLRSSEEIFNAVRCRSEYPRISNAIPNFHQGKVWLKGTSIGIFGSKYKD